MLPGRFQNTLPPSLFTLFHPSPSVPFVRSVHSVSSVPSPADPCLYTDPFNSAEQKKYRSGTFYEAYLRYMKHFPYGKYEALLHCMKRDPKGSHVFLPKIWALNFCLSTSGSTVNMLITNKLQVAWLLFFIVIGKILF